MMTHAEATFRFTAAAPMHRVTPLFGAHREREWAAGWEPRFIHPAAPADREGMVFTVQRDRNEAVWVNTRLDLAAGIVQYVYVLPGELATLISLRLTPDGERTQVEVTYQRTALNRDANARVEQMSAADRMAGPEWEREINACLGRTI
jgi:hypothetical protein